MGDKKKELVDIIINKSLKIEEKDNVLIMMENANSMDLVKRLVNDLNGKKANTIVRIKDSTLDAMLLEKTSANRIELLKDINNFDVKNFDCFINIKCNKNDYEDHKVDRKIISELSKALEKDNDIKINKKRWILLNYPSDVDSFKMKMNTDEFYNYAFDAMTYDFDKIKSAVYKLKKIMEDTKEVKIVTESTDVTSSICDIPVVPCLGKKNIPDGEIYTAPVKDSVNGYITYNVPSPYRGEIFEEIYFKFEDGKIIEAKCNTERLTNILNEILDTDQGARYIGEFAIGLNPLIKVPMGDILYDEKILGSIHLTPGHCYKDSDNKNKSNIHWDLVLNMNLEYGGGSLYFDNVLIAENGKFVIKELIELNKK